MKKIIGRAYTYDDLLILPSYSEVMPVEVDTTAFLTNDIKINIPLVSAAMDTVSDGNFAIAIANLGGFAVIHKNMTYEEQAAEIKKVKKYESWIVRDPITVSPYAPISEAIALQKKHDYSGIPVVDQTNKIVGIITNRDVRFIEDNRQQVFNIMTKDNLVTAKEGISLIEAKKLLHKHRLERLIIIDNNGIFRGLITVKDIEKFDKFPFACRDEKSRLRVGAAVGVGIDAIERSGALITAEVDALVVDTAHGHTKSVVEAVKHIKKLYNVPVIAGNIATPEAAKVLIDCGVDAVKVGVGPGSICTTRVVSGVGVPQAYAVMQIAEVCKKNNVRLIADGGIKYSGDIAKAIGLGADVVMIGSLFAGTSEGPGETILYKGSSYKTYRGMGSLSAMQKGSKDRYFQSGTTKLVPEGVEGMVPHRGKLKDVVHQLVGGLRAAMGYTGNRTIEDMKINCQFIEITSSALKESHPHDVFITKEAPNYSSEGVN